MEKYRKLKIVRVIKGKKLVLMVYCPKEDAVIPRFMCRTCPYSLGGVGRSLYCGFDEIKRPINVRVYGF